MIHVAGMRLCRCGVVHRPAGSDLTDWRRTYRMLFLANASKNSMLDQFGTIATFGSLHTAYSTTGTNEVTGGSPAYARMGLTWASASGGSKALAATLPAWNVPASITVGWWGQWSAVSAGTFYGMLPLGAGTLRPASVETSTDVSNADIYSNAHGYVLDNRVVFWGTLPTGLTVGTIYWVIATGLAANSFRVSTTQGGAAVTLSGTQPFAFFVQRAIPQTTVTQDIITLASGSIDLSVVA